MTTSKRTKRIMPYERLMQRVCMYQSKVVSPRVRGLWSYPKDRLAEGWPLTSLYERTKAADTLGYDVRLRAMEDGSLRVEYVERVPSFEMLP